MTTEEKATAYAERYEARPMAETAIRAYIAGATEALASQWRSVEEELPEDDETVLTYSSYGHVLAYYSEQDRMWFAYGNYGDINPTHWMQIPTPSLPDTNTEKK